MFDFQNLPVYKKAKLFHVNCKKIILEKKLDKYVLDQLGRASFSVPLNIAEGSGKFSKADRKNYFTTARASVFECVAVLDILKDERKLSDSEFEGMLKDADELSKILYAMIKNLSWIGSTIQTLGVLKAEWKTERERCWEHCFFSSFCFCFSLLFTEFKSKLVFRLASPESALNAFFLVFSNGLSHAWSINITFDCNDQTGIYQYKGAGSS